MLRFRWFYSGDFAGIVLATSVLLAAIPASAGPIPWHKNLAEARRTVSASRKPLIVVVGAKWCSYCEKMKQQTLNDPAVFRQITEHFVPVMIDADDQPDEARQLNADELPAIIILSSDAKVLTHITGFQSASQLTGLLARYQPTWSTRQLHPTRDGFLTTHPVRRLAPSQASADVWGYGVGRPNWVALYQSVTPPEKQNPLDRTIQPPAQSTRTSFLRSHAVRPEPKGRPQISLFYGSTTAQ